MVEIEFLGFMETLSLVIEEIWLELSETVLFFRQKQSKTGGVDRMTDTSTYTGSHKERFDESGKGKGLEGRKDYDAKAAEGYVGGYKGKDTYDKTH